MTEAVQEQEAITHVYDDLAEIYDERYDYVHCPPCLAENDHAFNEVLRGRSKSQTMLDLGSGTGLAVDLGMVLGNPDQYVAVDPSRAMLDRLVEKYPWVTENYALTAEEFVRINRGFKYDTVISLFGSPSYIHPGTIRELPSITSGRLVLMHYVEGYFPDYYGRAERDALTPLADASREAAASLKNARVSVFNNMQIVVVDND